MTPEVGQVWRYRGVGGEIYFAIVQEDTARTLTVLVLDCYRSFRVAPGQTTWWPAEGHWIVNSELL